MTNKDSETYRKYMIGPVVIDDAWIPGLIRRVNGVDYCDACGKKWDACKNSCTKTPIEEN